MGTILVSTLIDKATTLLFDGNNIRWSRQELLRWFNDAQRCLVSLVPETSAAVSSVQLAAGVKQALPSAGWVLLEVTHNMGLTGTVPGRMIKRVDRAQLDETNPEWSAAASSNTTTMYMYNLRDRTSFYVYPPSAGANYVEIVYSVTPTELTEPDAITVADIYVPALLDYIMWRAHSKGAEFANDSAKAQAYFQSFMLYLKGVPADTAKLAAEMGHFSIPVPQGQGTGG